MEEIIEMENSIDCDLVNAESVAWAIELANIVRKKKGEELLGDKLPFSSEVGDAKHCVLAKALNFDCRIAGPDFFSLGDDIYDGDAWLAEFKSDKEDVAQILASALGVDVITDDYYSYSKSIDDTLVRYYVPLPNDISAIALAFDNNQLDAKYMES